MDAHVEIRALLIAAAREFNAGRYFEAHEVLEEGLETVPDTLWDFAIGLIQTAVGYHKITQQLWSGARRMLGIGLQKLERFPVDAGGLQLERLRRRARADRDALAAGTFDPDAFVRNPPRMQLLVPAGGDQASGKRPT